MIPTLNHYYLARLTLETATPLSIGAGGGDGVFDTVLIRDANGLPTLPGTAIAGVLRHLFWELHQKPAMQKVFGFHDGEKGTFSRLQVSWGCIQDSTGKPVEGLLLGNIKDPLLKAALASRELPVHRDRVRIGHCGAADNHGKFDRTVLPAGYRFSTELALWSEKPNDPQWQQLLELLKHPLFRLGSNTRVGLGAIKLVSAHTGHFDLSTPRGRTDFAKLPRGIGVTQGLTTQQITATRQQRFLTATVKLTPRNFWRVGQGEQPNTFDSNGKPADMLPKLEQRLIWDEKTGRGAFGAAQLLVPASSVKGALAHRIAFHANCRAGRWAENLLANGNEYAKENDPEIRDLFGFARNDKDANTATISGRVGRVLIDDGFVEFTTNDVYLMMHNIIDRFTGGVRDHMLFMEELVWHKGIEVKLTVDTQDITAAARQSLQLALNDLCTGRLSLGSGVAKGHGLFTGNVAWSDNGQWINSSSPITAKAA